MYVNKNCQSVDVFFDNYDESSDVIKINENNVHTLFRGEGVFRLEEQHKNEYEITLLNHERNDQRRVNVYNIIFYLI